MRLADRILALHAGRPIAFGVPEQVRDKPAVADATSEQSTMLLEVRDLEVAYDGAA